MGLLRRRIKARERQGAGEEDEEEEGGGGGRGWSSDLAAHAASARERTTQSGMPSDFSWSTHAAARSGVMSPSLSSSKGKPTNLPSTSLLDSACWYSEESTYPIIFAPASLNAPCISSMASQ